MEHEEDVPTRDLSIDEIESAWLAIRETEARCAAAKRELAEELVRRTTEAGIDAKTRRLRGDGVICRLVMPGVDYDQALLREAWNLASEADRKDLLRIEKIGVMARAIDVAEREVASPERMATVARIVAARRESQRAPTVSWEPVGAIGAK